MITLRRRRAMTLVELLVVLTILGLVAGVAGLALRRASPVATAGSTASLVSDARREAIELGHAVTVVVPVAGRVSSATAFPDGSVVADAVLGVERFTGEVRRDSL
ncbi:MAG: pilus assembly FimT family protein [Steroidobacteraceae bacterium]